MPKNHLVTAINLFSKANSQIVKSKLYLWLDPRNYQGLERSLRSISLLALVVLLLFSATSPLFELYITHKYYSFKALSSKLVGNVSDSLAKQITYDTTGNAYVFNAAGLNHVCRQNL